MPRPKPRPPSRRPPPIWAGCDLFAWLRLLARHRCAVDRSRWRLVATATASSFVQTGLGFVQQIALGGEVAKAEVRPDPIFILGHWRSGTTFLHDLLARDARHAGPTSFDCFNAHHFVLTRSWLPGVLRRVATVARPMDAVPADWDRPQEDEFALLVSGQPSPYERIAFPNHAAGDAFELSPPARRAWERGFYRFVRALTVVNPGRRLVFKSPPHAGRVPSLLRLFPQARFVYLVRDPYAVYGSTLHLWRTLAAAHGLQRADWQRLPEYVLSTFTKLHDAFERARPSIPAGRLHEVRYEDLVRDPVGQLAGTYESLGLGEFGPVRPRVEADVRQGRSFEPAAHVLTAGEAAAVTARWGPFLRRHGYPVRDAGLPPGGLGDFAGEEAGE